MRQAVDVEISKVLTCVRDIHAAQAIANALELCANRISPVSYPSPDGIPFESAVLANSLSLVADLLMRAAALAGSTQEPDARTELDAWMRAGIDAAKANP